MKVKVFLTLLLAGCGDQVIDPGFPLACEDLLVNCHHTAQQQSGSTLGVYTRLFACAEDVGICVKRQNRQEDCPLACSLTYGYDSCMEVCEQ